MKWPAPEFLTMMAIGNFPWPRECEKPTKYALRLAFAKDPVRQGLPERVEWDLELSHEKIGASRAAGSVLLDRIIAQAIVFYVELATKDVPGGQVRIPLPAALSMVRGILDKVAEMKESEQ